jgi:hypothetical protein
MAAVLPQQTSDELPSHLREGLHSSSGEMTWNDRHGRRADRGEQVVYSRFPPYRSIIDCSQGRGKRIPQPRRLSGCESSSVEP